MTFPIPLSLFVNSLELFISINSPSKQFFFFVQSFDASRRGILEWRELQRYHTSFNWPSAREIRRSSLFHYRERFGSHSSLFLNSFFSIATSPTRRSPTIKRRFRPSVLRFFPRPIGPVFQVAITDGHVKILGQRGRALFGWNSGNSFFGKSFPATGRTYGRWYFCR